MRVLSVSAFVAMVLTEAFSKPVGGTIWRVMLEGAVAIVISFLSSMVEKVLVIVASAGLAWLFVVLANLLLPFLVAFAE